MKLDEHSPEARFSRSAATQSLKCRNINPRTHHPKEEIVQPIRCKRAADSARSVAQSGNAEVADHEYNESSFPFRQRTNSTTSIDTVRIRSTATKLKNDTDVVAAPKPAPHNSIPSLTSFKQGSKQKSSFQSTTTTHSESTSSLSLSTANAKAPRKKKSKKSGNGPVPKSLPTIFNVGQSSLLVAPSTTTVTIATATHSDFSLDDLPSWNMDTPPSSRPDSPVTRSNTPTTASLTSSYSTPYDAPFSTPYDEDALLENEVPFPFNKHAGVIIENMGVKKAKNLNKGKESLLNRHITTVGPDLYPPPSGPTLPLSLRSLSPNTTNIDPLADNIPHTTTPRIPVAPFSSTKDASGPTLPLSLRSLSPNTTDIDLLADNIPHTITPRIPVAPFSSTKDAWGCIHLGPADCELSIAFPQTSHFEVWDMDDEAFFACPLFLCLMAKDPRLWTGTPISLPDVSLVDIRCDDLPVPSCMSVYDPSIEYAVHCTVPQNGAWNRNLLPPYSSSKKTEFASAVSHSEITIEGKWERIYTKPKMEGQTPILRIARDSKYGYGDEDGTMMNERGWYLKIWIPIPARLFMKRETRIFEVRASVWMMRVGGERRVLNLMDSEEEDFPLIAEAEMTVSHLRREREMMMW